MMMQENNLLEILFPKLRSTCLCDTGWSSSDTEVIESTMQVAEPNPDNLLEVFFPKMYRPYMCDSGRNSSVVQASGSVMAIADPSPFGIGLKNWVAAEEAAREIIQKVHPTSASEERRSSVTNFVQRLIRDQLGLVVLPFGSVPLKTYIPDGDMDFTAFCGGSEDVLAGKLKAVLHEAERNVTSEFVVKDVQLIPAEVKLVKCTIQNIVVDISFNQIGGVSTLCFLEQIDRLVGKDHLFKRSIMLIKSWSYYESRILGAQHRLLSTYALETMVLHVINLYHSTLNGPVAVLVKFLDYFSKFDWGTFCVSLNGPVWLASLPDIIIEMPEDADGDLLLENDLLRFWIDMFSAPTRGSDIKSRGFQKKQINIIDPLKLVNNLGRSVNKGNFYRIRSAFTYGAKRLSWILSQPENSIAGELKKFFSNTMAWQETRCRPDVSLVGSRLCKIDNSAHENYKHTSFRNSGSPLCGVSGGLLSEGFEASQKQDGNSNLTPSRILFHYDHDLLIDLSGDFDLYFEWFRYGSDNTLPLHASHMLSSPTAPHQNCKLQFQQQDFPCHGDDDFCASTQVRALLNMIESDDLFGREVIQLDQGTTTYISGLDQFQNMIKRKKEAYPPSSPCTMIIRKEASSPGSPCIYKPNIIFEEPVVLVRSGLKPSLLRNLFVENKKLGFCNSSPLPFASGKGCPFTNDLMNQSNGIADIGSVENASRMSVS